MAIVWQVAIIAAVMTSHRGVHLAESAVFPGAGLFESDRGLAIAFACATIAATVLWMAWGAEWPIAALWAASLLATLAWATPLHDDVARAGPRVARSAHEFPLVIAVVAAVGWVRGALWRLPGASRWRAARQRRRRLAARPSLSPVDTCRAASITALAAALVDPATPSGTPDVSRPRNDAIPVDPVPSPPYRDARVLRRARLVGGVARGRWRGDPLRHDQAAARTAAVLCGPGDDVAAGRFVDESRRRAAGVLASEPGWVRPLDAVLAALALERLGGDTAAFRGRLATSWRLGRGHRPAWWYEPLGIASGRAPAWEHATMSALCRMRGWVGDDDWQAVRQAALGAASRRDDDPSALRLVAAAQLWLTFVDDVQARRLIDHREPTDDGVAAAIAGLAGALRAVDGVHRADAPYHRGR